MRDVLVHAQDLHALEPGRIFRGLDQHGPDLGPEGVPGRAELPGAAPDRRSLSTELPGRPTDRTGAQQPSWQADRGILLNERDDREEVFAIDPVALAPPDQDRPTRPGTVGRLDHDPAMTSGDGTAAAAAGHRVTGLDLEEKARSSLRDRNQAEAGEVEKKLAAVAAIKRVRAYATTVAHRRGP